MRVWLITVGEPLPGLSGNSRLWRTGMLSGELGRRGHDVTWWTSRFDHFGKRFFDWQSRDYSVEANVVIRFLDGRPYSRNIGVARMVNHWQVARDFRALADGYLRPDVILCSFPTIELGSAATRLGRRWGIPVLLDVRDLWPDIFLDAAPRPLKPVARLLLHPYFRATTQSLQAAAGIVAVSRGYLDWGVSRAGRAEGGTDRVFPLGYSLPRPTVESRDAGRAMLGRYGVGGNAIACLFAGTLGRTYDLAPVLQAARDLVGRPFRFVICGDGERAPEWRERAKGLENVHFTGWLDQQDMRAALAGADIGLAAYATGAPQGLPNKVIEYLAAGLPVLSSLEGETRQLLNEQGCGCSYPASDAHALVAALASLEPPDRRAQMSGRSRRVFEARFQAQTVYGELADFLEEQAGAGHETRR
jgi:glycosyltransferase involved in cell wall biosynthesis